MPTVVMFLCWFQVYSLHRGESFGKAVLVCGSAAALAGLGRSGDDVLRDRAGDRPACLELCLLLWQPVPCPPLSGAEPFPDPRLTLP